MASITLPKGVWTKVADAAVSGNIWEQSTIARIIMVQSDVDVIPTTNDDAVHIFGKDCNFIPINSTVPKYVYMKAVNHDGKVLPILA